MGTVFLGHDPALGRDVAIKLLRPGDATAVAVERFLREMRLLARLNHPNIVPVIEAGHEAPLLWFVMPVMGGDTLAAAMQRGRLPLADVQQVASDLLQALIHAHGHGVVHRDIKPSNIFLQDGRAVLADFGVAAAADDDHSLTIPNVSVGTPRYMAPEQRAGEPATAASDIYAAGVTLFEVSTGLRWNGADGTKSWSRVPRPMRAAIRRALQARPDDRWPDATAFLRALQHPSPPRWLLPALTGMAVLGVMGLGFHDWNRPLPANSARRGVALLALHGNAVGRYLVSTATSELEWFFPINAMPAFDAAALTEGKARDVATMYVTGTIETASNGHGRAVVTIRDSLGGVAFQFDVQGSLTDSARWAHDLADSIVARLLPARTAEFRQLTGTSHNGLALRAFAAGDSLFLRGDAEGAQAQYRNAFTIDRSFLRARWAEVLTRQWLREPFESQLDSLATMLPTGDPLSSARVSIVLTLNAHAAAPWLDQLRQRAGRAGDGAIVQIGPLDVDATGALVEHMCPDWSSDERQRLARRLMQEAGGAPAIIVELLEAIRKGLDLLPETRWPVPDRTYDSTLPAEDPPALVAAVRVSFNALSTDGQRLLRVASLARQPFSVADLTLGAGVDTSIDALDRLEHDNWLVSDARGYSFPASAVRRIVANDMITPGERRRLQSRLGVAAAITSRRD